LESFGFEAVPMISKAWVLFADEWCLAMLSGMLLEDEAAVGNRWKER
jgi:hypothetical protein